MPYQLKRVQRLSEIKPLLDQPYNRPDMADSEQEERFWAEYENIDAFIRSKLEKYGNIDAFGKAEFSMGDPWNNSRHIGIVVNDKRLFTKQLLDTLWSAVQEIPVDYMIVLEGEYNPGGGNFYICIRKDNGVVAYAPDRNMLVPFGFK